VPAFDIHAHFDIIVLRGLTGYFLRSRLRLILCDIDENVTLCRISRTQACQMRPRDIYDIFNKSFRIVKLFISYG